MSSRGCNPRGTSKRKTDPERVGHRRVCGEFGPFRAGDIFARLSRGLHPRLFMFKPFGLVGTETNLPCKWLRCASRRRCIPKLPVGCVRERGCVVLDQPQQLANLLRLVEDDTAALLSLIHI